MKMPSVTAANVSLFALHGLYVYSQESLRHVCFFQFFYLCPATALLHQKSSNRPGNGFPLGNYHHISFIRAIKTGVLTKLIHKICHKGLFAFTENCFLNRSQRTVSPTLQLQT